MPRRKQPSAGNTTVNPSPLRPSGPSSPWKAKVIGILFFFILLTVLWGAGIFKELFAGPKIPIPRETAGFSLGMEKADLLNKYPDLKKKLRPFNNDPLFQIATLTASSGITGASSVDLLFYKDQLYFISSMWDSEAAKAVPLEDWAKQYRRWSRDSTGGPESLGAEVLLREWHFNDGKTEMTLRNLSYTGHLQKWQDLRDSDNSPAQTAFAKYRIDAGS